MPRRLEPLPKAADLEDWTTEQPPTYRVAGVIKSMGDALAAVRSTQPLWFRGHANSAWELLPSFLRSSVMKRVRAAVTVANRHQSVAEEYVARKVEYEMLKATRRDGASLVPQNNTLAYFRLQHHGFPTRLLDWTTNVSVAMFFAVVDHPERDGALYVLSPAIPAIPVKSHKLLRRAIDGCYTATFPPIIFSVLTVLPERSNGRLFDQHAAFTFHDGGSREWIGPRYVRRYRIPRRAKARIRRELRDSGTDWFELFRDLDHLSRQVRERLDAGEYAADWAEWISEVKSYLAERDRANRPVRSRTRSRSQAVRVVGHW